MATLDELAAQFGGSSQPFGMTQEAPEGVRTPWQGLPPARADMARQRAFEQAQKYLQENAAVVNQGGEVLSELERFGELNRKSGTGALYEGTYLHLCLSHYVVQMKRLCNLLLLI